MAEFVMLIAGREADQAQAGQAEMAKAGQTVAGWWADHEANGRIKPGGKRLLPSATATTVRVENGAAVVTDGPFIEAKEMMGGFGVIEADSIEEAVELVKTWPGMAAAIEVRPVWQM